MTEKERKPLGLPTHAWEDTKVQLRRIRAKAAFAESNGEDCASTCDYCPHHDTCRWAWHVTAIYPDCPLDDTLIRQAK